MKPNTLEQGFSAQPGFNVVIGYEDYASGLRALELYHRLLAQWANTGDFRLSIWKFEPLVMPGLLFKAAEDAIEADLVIISVRGDRPLAPVTHAWLDAWRTENKREAGVALLIDPANRGVGQSARTKALVQGMAEESGFQFFCAFEDVPESEPSVTKPRDAQLSHASVFGRSVYIETGVDHWGLNE